MFSLTTTSTQQHKQSMGEDVLHMLFCCNITWLIISLPSQWARDMWSVIDWFSATWTLCSYLYAMVTLLGETFNAFYEIISNLIYSNVWISSLRDSSLKYTFQLRNGVEVNGTTRNILKASQHNEKIHKRKKN